uniref:beta-glucosidase n=1 Tax=Alexandrium monilatum TaxID=311494 RepID=A0A7S4WBQ9_9DINO|mmetsp:Transcript_53252/g.158777  ORF Transcript_53252/g.158777 Transcript_53252/m.158777 type:complete len:1095 (+) Transcript_53252:76-3360(+)
MDGFFFDFDVLEDKKEAGVQKESGEHVAARTGDSQASPEAGGEGGDGPDGEEEAFPRGVTPLSEEVLAQENESSCWHSAAGDSSATGAESCRSCSTWQTGGSATPSERDENWAHPMLPRSDTCSSLASSWCSDSEPMTPTTAQTSQDRWTPAPTANSKQPEPQAPVSISAATNSLMRFGLPLKSKVAVSEPVDAAKRDSILDDDDYVSKLACRTAQTLMPSELVGLMCGKDFWHNHGVPRIGIPAICFSDGPFGVRGTSWSGPCSVVTPCGMALGSSWNVDLVKQVGTMLGEEAKTKGANVLLGPTVNLARVPISGRNYEMMGEDPHLVSKLGVAYVQGVQGVEGVGACVKHLVANDQERSRFFISAEVDHDVLHEVHLRPFEAAVKEGHVMAVMTAYNRVNGVFCSEHKWLLEDVLRKTWGFKGMVISDWGGAHDTEKSLKAGLDVEMPKSDDMTYGDTLQKMLAEGKVSVSDVRPRAAEVLKVMARLGMLREENSGGKRNSSISSISNAWDLPGANDSPDMSPASSPSHSPRKKLSCCSLISQLSFTEFARPKPSPNTREQQDLLQRAAAEGVVLLKNKDEVLPLSRDRSIAVIGQNAASITVMGGGSTTVLSNRSERSLVAQLRTRGFERLSYEPGCRTGHYLPTLAPPFLRAKDGRGVLKGEFYDETARRGGIQSNRTPLVRTTIQHTEMGNWSGIFFDKPPGKLASNQAWSAVFEGVLSPEVTGPYELGMFASGSCKVFIDGNLVMQYPKPGIAPMAFIPLAQMAPEVREVVDLEAGRQYELKIHWMSTKDAIMYPAQCHIGGCSILDEDKWMDRAEEAARKADVALVCVGTDHWQECEGRDQASMALPGRASELVHRVAKANNRTVVILNVGSPKELEPWLGDAAALVAAWFGGQEAVAGLVDVLLGEGDGPSGRLPVTWPRCLDDGPTGKPPNARYPGEAAKVRYDEGLLLGYRWYVSNEIEPAFPFGHGLTYTFFEYIDFCLPDGVSYAVGKPVSVVVTVENVGDIRGVEVIQLYLMHLPKVCARPVHKKLAAFAKVPPLEPGDVVDVQLEVAASLLQVDKTPAEFELLVGPSCADVCFTKRITVV